MTRSSLVVCLCGGAFLVLWASAASLCAADDLDFSRDVLPILSDKCLRCHGPDAATRQGELRLDRREDAVAARPERTPAVVPGRAADSELVRRIVSRDAERRMPPPDSGKSLDAREIDILRRWIDSGAGWSKHWAFVPPRRPSLANHSAAAAAATPLDALVLARLSRESLSFAPRADLATLLRRVNFDLAGLPVTPDEVDELLADTAPDAYQRRVERLLASPRLGERFAMWWLDLARYSDTDGYQGDATRRNWPWRDWVVDAFNRNLPYDEFTRLQLAGDLSPQASTDDRIATCFQRNHMTNGEGGRDPEESRIDYVLDRVNTLGAVWLGLTLGCCQCHDHKYDPLSQADYYGLSAFFNSIDEDGRAGTNAGPYEAYQSPRAAVAVQAAQRLVTRRQHELEQTRSTALAGFNTWLATERSRLAMEPDFQAWQPLAVTRLESTDGSQLTTLPDGVIVASGADPRQEDYRVFGSTHVPRIAGLRLEVFPDATHAGGGLSRSGDGNFILTLLKLHVRERRGGTLRTIPLVDAVATYSAAKDKEGKGYGPVRETLDDDPRTGWSVRGGDLKRTHVAVFALGEPIELADDEELYVELGQRSLDGFANLGRFRLSITDQAGPAVRSIDPPPLEQLAATDSAAEVPEPLLVRLRAQFLSEHAGFASATAALARAEAQLSEAKSAAGKLNVMVLKQRAEARPTHVLVRGVWNQKGPQVETTAPVTLAPWPQDAPHDRAGLARWLTQRDHPLPARVLVNQLWQNLWGTGLVRTAEDFGLQGERPVHAEALDWLSVELLDASWDMKHVLREIVLSETYCQSSRLTPELATRDPENRLLARGARYRLPAWMIRDAALSASGLLVEVQGGPPVRPHQAPGVWEEIFMGRYQYEPSEGSEQYRRTLYAFWRRSIAPTFLFDSAQRRVCEVKTLRTNTPLHALTLLNDRTMLEAARGLAEQARSSASTVDEQLTIVWRRVLGRAPTSNELAVLRRQYHQAIKHYQDRPQDARTLLDGSSDTPVPQDQTQQQTIATLMAVANLVLNLDESLTRE